MCICVSADVHVLWCAREVGEQLVGVSSRLPLCVCLWVQPLFPDFSIGPFAY